MPPRSVVLAVLLPAVLRAQRPIVSGVADTVGSPRPTFAVTVVDSGRVRAPSVSPLGMLAGKVAGLRIVAPSGQPGTTPVAVLRGASGSFASDPLIVVDGVVTRLSLADLNAEDIDRVEVVHGAAGSASYGADAGNGVIHIITRRATDLRDGEPRMRVRNEVGASALPRRLGVSSHHYFQLNADSSDFVLTPSGLRAVEEDRIADAPYPSYRDPVGAIVRSGIAFTNYVSFGQRRGGTAFDVSLHNLRDQGTMALIDGMSRQSGRLSADQRVVDKVRASATLFLARSASDEAANQGQNFTATRYLEPSTPLDSVTTACPTAWPTCYVRVFPTANFGPILNPLSQNQLNENRVTRDRVTGHLGVAYDATAWLSIAGRSDVDRVDEDRTNLAPLLSGPAEIVQTLTTADHVSRLSASVVGRRTLLRGRLNTSGRAEFQQERRSNKQHMERVQQPPPTPITSEARRIEANSKGAAFSAWSEYAERFTLDGSLRHERRSVFAAALGGTWYSRFGGAYRLSRDVPLPGVSDLRVRISHGDAGTPLPETLLFPSLTAAAVTSPPVPLRAPRTRETEYGVDIAASWLSLGYTFAARRDVDQLQFIPIPIVTGYVNYWANVVSLRGSTQELTLDTRLVDNGSYSWRLGITAARTRSRVEQLRVPRFFLPVSRADFLVAPGETPGALVGDRWIRSRAQLDETIAAGRLSGTASDYVRNEDGYYVSAAAFHTINEAPLRAYRCDASDATGACTQSSSSFVLGTTMPDFDAGFHTNARWKSLALDATVSWQRGGSIYNSVRQSAFPAMTDPVVDQAGKPAPPSACPALAVDAFCPYSTGRKSISYYAAFYDTGNANDYFVESGSYVKLREVVAEWTLPKRWSAKIPALASRSARLGLVGRNLWTRSRYSGFDPEVANLAANAYAYGVDVGAYPVYRTISASLALDF